MDERDSLDDWGWAPRASTPRSPSYHWSATQFHAATTPRPPSPDPALVVDESTLTRDYLDKLDHVHSYAGRCIKNSLGPTCPAPALPTFPVPASWNPNTFTAAGTSLTAEQLKAAMDRLTGAKRMPTPPPLDDPEALNKWLDEE